MFKFGWLTITTDDLAIWEKYPTAAFTLYSTSMATAREASEFIVLLRRVGYARSRRKRALCWLGRDPGFCNGARLFPAMTVGGSPNLRWG
jgi:hypothetical protein